MLGGYSLNPGCVGVFPQGQMAPSSVVYANVTATLHMSIAAVTAILRAFAMVYFLILVFMLRNMFDILSKRKKETKHIIYICYDFLFKND